MDDGREQVTWSARSRDRGRTDRTVTLTPEFLERYEMGEALGAGSCGAVFRARQLSTDRAVAIKILTRMETGVLERFLREGRLLARVDHKNVVRVLDLDCLGECPYLVLELVEGGSLRHLMDGGRLEAARASALARGILRGLAACHEAGIVHRDVKPENILMASDGQPKLSDLGIASYEWMDAQLTQTGDVMGTPKYMSPEQVDGKPVTAAADLWAVGVVLFEMLTGRLPFGGRTLSEIFAAITTRRAPPVCELVPEVPAALGAIVAAALEKNPARRQTSAAAFVTALASVHRSGRIEVPGRR